ncbi:hypothetical protein FF2_040549 [Malus domestica]
MAEKRKKKKKNNNNEDKDDTFYYRYASSAPQTPKPTNRKTVSASGSGTLAPSKSTLNVSNFDTNLDLYTFFSYFGKIPESLSLRIVRLARAATSPSSNLCPALMLPWHGGGGGNGNGGGVARVDEEEYDSGGEKFEDDNWASVLDDVANLRLRLGADAEAEEKKKKVVKKAGYFSDESDDED